jgi:RND family efflux transporter MFP subunit
MSKWSVLILALGLLAGCGKPEAGAKAEASGKAEAPLAVQAEKAVEREIARSIQLTGSLSPDESVNLVFEVPGRIQKIHVDFGQPVRGGQVVAELDSTEFRLQIERTKSALAQQLARLGLDPSQVSVTPESTPGIRQAQAQLEDAWTKFDSARKLHQSGDISRDRFIEAEKAYNARLAVLEGQKFELRTQLASIQALQAEVKLAEKRLNDTLLRAPFDGSIRERPAAVGQYVKDNAVIATLVKTYPMRLRVEVPEGDVAFAKVGTTLTFTTDTAPGAEFHAVVRQLNPTLDARSRSLVAEARLQENDPRLRPGSFVQVKLTTAGAAQAIFIPSNAVVNIAGLTKAYAIRQGKASEVRFTPGPQEGGWVEVTGGVLRAGDAVAVNNLAALYEGRAVEVK